MRTSAVVALAGLLISLPTSPAAQEYDLLLKGGHLIDARNGIDRPMDVALRDGRVARVAMEIPSAAATRVVDARGLYVSPGFVDIHSHNYYGVEPNSAYSNGFNSLPPDGFTFRSGVTTVVDVGGAGWRDFPHFKEQVIDRSQTRVLAFLNIVGHGMKGGRIEQDLGDMDAPATAEMARRYPETVVGVKLAHFNGHRWEPVDRLIEAGRLADIPVMVDFGSASPPLSLATLLLEKFRPGDIYTHVYAAINGREAVVDENDGFRLRPGMLEAQRRGVVFDVGHGGSSFAYSVAVPAIEQGLKPNTISTDIHRSSMNAGMKDMSNVMSKFLNLGMTLQEVITASTWAPAQTIRRDDLGHLSEGAVADITVFTVRNGEFGFMERANGVRMPGTQKVEVELTLREGAVAWDLNGITAPFWGGN
jgi:dihydroorotase